MSGCAGDSLPTTPANVFSQRENSSFKSFANGVRLRTVVAMSFPAVVRQEQVISASNDEQQKVGTGQQNLSVLNGVASAVAAASTVSPLL